jgi:protein gp37
MQETSIGWTDFSTNLLKYRNAEGKTVWACVHASEGCRFCYSEALAKRWGRGEAFTAENMKSLTSFFDLSEAGEVLKSKKIAGKKVFVDDMTDLFGEWVSDEIIDQHFALFALRPDVTFQVLTKRAKRMREYIDTVSFADRVYTVARSLGSIDQLVLLANLAHGVNPIRSLPNVHLGVSVEDQKTADERIQLLLETPAAVRWASVEPLLGELTLDVYFSNDARFGLRQSTPTLDGIVIGGESGHGHREMPLTSAISLALNAKEAGIAVYFKQDSGPRPGMQGRVPDDVWAMKEWPAVSYAKEVVE